MKRLVVSLCLLALAACQSAGAPRPADNAIAAVFDGSAGTWVDLTHAFTDDTVFWPTDTLGFAHEELSYGVTPGGWFYSAYRYSAAEHGGTHLDAPIHFAQGRLAADAVPLSSLIGPAMVVDVSDRAHRDYQVSVADLRSWESAHGAIPDGAIVLLRTGWGAKYGDRTAYLGTALTGPDAVPELHFPGLDPQAAQWLVDHRSVSAVGLDTPSLDFGQSKDFRSHVILNSANVPGFENVASLEELPPAGAYVVALPMKIGGGSGGPLRIVAFVPASLSPGR